jgi:hypothetical protein
MPGDRHTLDENASKTEPAKLLGRVRGRHGRKGTVNAAQVNQPQASLDRINRILQEWVS